MIASLSKENTTFAIDYFSVYKKMTIKEIDKYNALFRETMIPYLGIELQPTDNEEEVKATLPIDNRTCTHMGGMNGGAALTLAESLAGVGSHIIVRDKAIVRGIQVTGNHVGATQKGDLLTGIGRIVHRGRSQHVWQIEIRNTEEKLISTVTVVNLIINSKESNKLKSNE